MNEDFVLKCLGVVGVVGLVAQFLWEVYHLMKEEEQKALKQPWSVVYWLDDEKDGRAVDRDHRNC